MCLRVVLIINQAYSHSLLVTWREMEFIFPIKWLYVFFCFYLHTTKIQTHLQYSISLYTHTPFKTGFVTFSCAMDPFESLVKPMDPFSEKCI